MYLSSYTGERNNLGTWPVFGAKSALFNFTLICRRGDLPAVYFNMARSAVQARLSARYNDLVAWLFHFLSPACYALLNRDGVPCLGVPSFASLLAGCLRPVAPLPSGRPTLQTLDGQVVPSEGLEALINVRMAAAGVTGIACAIINDGHVVYRQTLRAWRLRSLHWSRPG